MFSRETRRTNRDGSVVSYLQLAHNERHPVSGNPVAKVIHNFGRADKVDRAGLARLVSSISRFLTPEQAAAAATAGGQVEVLDSRRLGGAWTLDRLWERLGIGAALRQVAAGRRYDSVAVERVLFALVAQRALEPGSKLAATRWVAERVAIERLVELTDDQAYRAMDFLLDALPEIAAEVFGSVAHLLNLDLDIVFVDTTSTYWEVETADTDPELADPTEDDELTSPTEVGTRRRALQGLPARSASGGDRDGGYPRRGPGAVLDLSRQHRRHPGHPHRQGRPGRVGAAPAGMGRRPRVRLRGEPGLPDPRGGHYIHAEKLRHTNTEAAAALARPGATAPWPTTCASKRSTSPQVGTATATTAPAPSGS